MSGSSTKRFPLYANDYELFEEVGEGVSATVYRARCIALNEIVAVKILDLEKCRNDLETIRKEVHIMSLIDHPNLLKAHCSFIDRSSLWIVMPYMSGGSCFHLMKSVYPEGLEQPIIATLLREVLKALVYLHQQGHIHRDVKAGNILIHSKGVVKLGDFGVSACMFDSGDRMRTRNTFVGTPCWMAPEVMQQVDGYDFKADIWSFGITALELAHGHAPFSKFPPMKVLLMILQNAPPRLDHDRDKKFSKYNLEDMMNESNSQLTGSLLPSFHRKFLPTIGYQVGILSNESNACSSSEGAAERLAVEEPDQLEPLVDIKQMKKAGAEPQEKPKNGYTVSPVNRASCSATEILPLLQSLLVQNDIQRAKVMRLIRFFDQNAETGNPIPKTEGVSQIYPSREKDLQSQVQFLEKSVEKLVDEVQRRKEINSQLEQKISSLMNRNSIP